MPKQKTRKGVQKRVRITKKGKVKFFRAGKGHLLTGKNSKRRRSLRRGKILSESDYGAIKMALPYGA